MDERMYIYDKLNNVKDFETFMVRYGAETVKLYCEMKKGNNAFAIFGIDDQELSTMSNSNMPLSLLQEANKKLGYNANDVTLVNDLKNRNLIRVFGGINFNGELCKDVNFCLSKLAIKQLKLSAMETIVESNEITNLTALYLAFQKTHMQFEPKQIEYMLNYGKDVLLTQVHKQTNSEQLVKEAYYKLSQESKEIL